MAAVYRPTGTAPNLPLRRTRRACALQQMAVKWPQAGRVAPGASDLAETATTTGGAEQAPIIIKKYANRRLYNTASSSYVTLDHLCHMVKEGKEFVVYDAKTGEDITRSVLTQIIFEEESKGQNLLPIGFLRQLISLYGDSLQALVPGYLEVSMQSFSRNQEQMRKYMADAFGEMFPFKRLEEMGRQNMQLFQRAMAMFNPFAAAEQAAGKESARAPEADKISALKAQVDALQKRLDELAKKD
jgi:polyhydroxyalkanoate synthesis repressor PhaR